MKFSKNLQELRNSKKLSQEQLAEKIGVSRQAISSWESGKTLPEIDKVAEICKVFEISSSELLGEISKKSEQKFDKKAFRAENIKIATIKATGVAGILLGVAASLHFNIHNAIPVLIGVAFSLPLFIFGNSLDEISKKELKNADISKDIFSDSELRKAKLQKTTFIALGISGILIAVLAQVVLSENFRSQGISIDAIFMTILAVAIWLLIFGGQNDYIEKIEDKLRDKNPTAEKINSIIMLSATAIFFIHSFVIGGSWSISWIWLVLGGIACGINEILIKNRQEK